ncbi:MAG: zinc ribbon domain-containing protein [Nitrospirota bacterium]
MEERIESAQPKGAFRCPRCGSVTWGNLRFCSECGEPLDTRCKECGAKWRYIYEYAFCPSCGAKIKRKL